MVGLRVLAPGGQPWALECNACSVVDQSGTQRRWRWKPISATACEWQSEIVALIIVSAKKPDAQARDLAQVVVATLLRWRVRLLCHDAMVKSMIEAGIVPKWRPTTDHLSGCRVTEGGPGGEAPKSHPGNARDWCRQVPHGPNKASPIRGLRGCSWRHPENAQLQRRTPVPNVLLFKAQDLADPHRHRAQ